MRFLRFVLCSLPSAFCFLYFCRMKSKNIVIYNMSLLNFRRKMVIYWLPVIKAVFIKRSFIYLNINQIKYWYSWISIKYYLTLFRHIIRLCDRIFITKTRIFSYEICEQFAESFIYLNIKYLILFIRHFLASPVTGL